MAPPPLIFPVVVQQQQHGGALVASTAGDSQYATYSVTARWGGVLEVAEEMTSVSGHGVKSVRISRGRDDAMTAMRAGTATIVLHDPDGRYNPDNTAGALYGDLLPMTQVSIKGNNGGGDFSLFYGFVRSIEHNPDRDAQETTIECIDRFVELDQAKPVVELTGSPNLTTGDVIAGLLGLIGETNPDPAYAVGDTIGTTFTSDGTKSVLSMIEDLLVSERGVYYFDAGGNDVYESRADRTARTSVAAITDTMSSLRPGVDLDRVANRARVTRTGGNVQEANDTTSQDLYGVRDVGDIETSNLVDDAAALTLAEYLVDQFKDPRSPMFALEQMNRDSITMDEILQRELQDRITVSDSRGGTSGDYHIEAIEHEITEGGKWHRCRWILSARGAGTQTGSTGVVGGYKRAASPPGIYVATASVLPTAPSGGTEVYYEAASGVTWHLRYNAQSASSYKWEFVGGAAMNEEIATSQSTTSTSYVDLTTAGPDVTVPFAGDYEITFGADLNNSGANYSIAAVKIGAAATSDNDAVYAFSGSASGVDVSVSRTLVKTGVAASTVLKVQYKAGAGTLTSAKRFLFVRPIRVTA